MNRVTYDSLKLRLEENRMLGRGGVGRWRLTKPVVEWLAVNPWRIIMPVAVMGVLMSWWILRERMTVIVLRVFGGP